LRPSTHFPLPKKIHLRGSSQKSQITPLNHNRYDKKTKFCQIPIGFWTDPFNKYEYSDTVVIEEKMMQAERHKNQQEVNAPVKTFQKG
jgi:hypothetical protein